MPPRHTTRPPASWVILQLNDNSRLDIFAVVYLPCIYHIIEYDHVLLQSRLD
jgi:hypothetical protein